MGLSNSPSKAKHSLILDASVAINLAASGIAVEIIRALPSRAAVTPSVIAEFKAGQQDRHKHREDLLNSLITDRLIDIAELGEKGLIVFTQLVSGGAATTLDDGEAETVAYAVESGAVAVIDEKKANRICTERFPQLKLASTTDLFMHPNVLALLKREQLIQGVLKALQAAHMQVPLNHVPWVIELIGVEEAKRCLSLPRSARG